MTDELLKEAIYAVALRDMLNKYPNPNNIFAKIFLNHLKSMDLNFPKAQIFYSFCVESARRSNEMWTRIIGSAHSTYLREAYTKIVTIDEQELSASKYEEYIKLPAAICFNGKYFHPMFELDYKLEDLVKELRKTPEYMKIDFKQELVQMKIDSIQEDF